MRTPSVLISAAVLALLLSTPTRADDEIFESTLSPLPDWYEPHELEKCLQPPIDGPFSGRPVTRDEVRQYQRDKCKRHLKRQTIREEGCLSRTIIRLYCKGQCRSGDDIMSCNVCRPESFRTVTYTLSCPGQTPSTRKKRVQRAWECRCKTMDLYF